jgi:hypothetical protein
MAPASRGPASVAPASAVPASDAPASIAGLVTHSSCAAEPAAPGAQQCFRHQRLSRVRLNLRRMGSPQVTAAVLLHGYHAFSYRPFNGQTA